MRGADAMQEGPFTVAKLESRRIFQRMNSYAIYRIAETPRVLFFMTLAIVVFNFHPLTAVMIVMLALLDDEVVLSIADDNVPYKDHLEAWNMRMVLGISTVLGIIGGVSAFGPFCLSECVFRLDPRRPWAGVGPGSSGATRCCGSS